MNASGSLRRLVALSLLLWVSIGFSASEVACAQTTFNDTSSAMPSMPGMTMDAAPETTPSSPIPTTDIHTNAMADMDMQDNGAQSMVLVDQLEVFHGRDGDGQAWDAEAWYGTDINKLWLRSEGSSDVDHGDDADLEALWSHATSAFWNTQTGVRQDVGTGSHRTWAALGMQGLAPYWFDMEVTGYVSTDGYTAARVRAEYDVLFTQRWVLQPEFETNLYGKDDAPGSDVSDTQLSLRLRYDITRQFAPYVGVVWIHRFGEAASGIDPHREPAFDTQIVIGLHAWF
jgi:copper resistance protein B